MCATFVWLRRGGGGGGGRGVLLVLEELEVTCARRTKHVVSAVELSREDDVPARLGIHCRLDHVCICACDVRRRTAADTP